MTAMRAVCLPFLSVVFLVMTVSACAPAQQEASILISVDELAEALDSPDLVVLHVAREAEQYDAGHVPGATFVLLGDLVENRDGRLNVLPDANHLQAVLRRAGVSDDSRVVVYGDLDGLAASRAFFTLEALGHAHVSVLDGGLEAWQAAGHNVSTEPAETSPGTFTAQLRPELMVSADWIADHLGDDSVLLIDARPEAEYLGDEPGTDIERPGHIPDAVNLFWREELDELGRYRPLDEVRERWNDAGAGDHLELITYCRTGVQASHAYLTARLLGYAPKIYDPSFHEWSNLTHYPVARGE